MILCCMWKYDATRFEQFSANSAKLKSVCFVYKKHICVFSVGITINIYGSFVYKHVLSLEILIFNWNSIPNRKLT